MVAIAAESGFGFALVVGNGHSVADMYQGEVAVWVLSQSPDDEAENDTEVEADGEVEADDGSEDLKRLSAKTPVQFVDNSPKGSEAVLEASTSEVSSVPLTLGRSGVEPAYG